MDFYKVKVRKRGEMYEVYPEFISQDELGDLMTRGNDFYAVYDEQSGMWKRNPLFIQKVIDKDLWNKAKDSVKNSSLGKRVFGSGRWGTGSSAADIDNITSYLKKINH